MDKKMKKILTILIVVLIGLIIIIYFVTDIFKSPKTLFYKYLINGNLANITNRNYSEIIDELNEHKTYDFTGSVTQYVEPKQKNKNAFNVLNEIKSNYEIKVNNKDLYFNVQAKYKNKELWNAEILSNDTLLGVKEKNIENKYSTIDLTRLKETLEKAKMEPSQIQEILEKLHIEEDKTAQLISLDRYQLLYIGKEDLKTIKNTYMDIIYKQIPSKNYSVEKNVEIDVNGNNYKCNAYTLKLSDHQINTIYLKILEELKNDNLTLNLIVDKYNMLNFLEKDIEKERIIKDIEKKIEELSNLGPEYDNYEITVYESNSKTIKTEIKKDNESITLNVTKTKNSGLYLLQVNWNDKAYEVLINLSDSEENEKEIKLIYTTNTVRISTEITYLLHTNVDVNIPHFSKQNTNYLSDMESGELVELIQKLIDDDKHISDVMEELNITKKDLNIIKLIKEVL